MQDPVKKPPVRRRFPTLWAAVAVLSVVAVSLGAALIRIQNQTVEPRAFLVPPESKPSAPSAAALSPASAANPAEPAAAQPPAASATGPRILHPASPEPAVARPKP